MNNISKNSLNYGDIKPNIAVCNSNLWSNRKHFQEISNMRIWCSEKNWNLNKNQNINSLSNNPNNEKFRSNHEINLINQNMTEEN